MRNVFLIVIAFILFDAKDIFSQKKPAPKRITVKTQKAADKSATVEVDAAFQLKLRETLNANPASNELKLKIGEIVPEYKPYLSRNASPVRPAK